MSKKKPQLKRQFTRRPSPSWKDRNAFLLICLLITVCVVALVKSQHAPSNSDSIKPVKSEVPRILTQKEREAKIQATQSGRQATSRPVQPIKTTSVNPPQKLVLEKDSSTYPGQAPRMTPKVKPAAALVLHPKLDWNKPSIAFVIDDIGHEVTYDKIMDYLGDRIVYAILPHLRYSLFYSRKGQQLGADVILHLPLESELGIYPGPGLITNNMTESEVLKLVDVNLRSVPHAMGANNHMGSLGTSDPRLMNIILQDFKRRNMFFLDSYTSLRSQVVPISHHLHLPVLRRDVFLDNVEDPEAIRKQIHQTAAVASRSKFAIAIGHYKKHTLEVIAEEIPKLEKQGYQIVKLSDLMKHYA